jgi:hypothetical protein
MNRKLLLGTSALALVALFIRCTPPTMQDASLSLTAKPRTIQNDGVATSVITVSAVDEMSAAGTGTVHLSSGAGSLSGGMDVTLDSNGSGTASFTCDVMTDTGCTGKITVNGTWSHSGKMVTGSVTITVGIPDAGMVSDGGMDGGAMDAGANHMTVSLSKGTLVASTGDQLDVSAKLVINNMPVAGTQIDFSTTGGSFAVLPGTTTASAMTNASGVATTTLYAAGSPPMLATVTASGMGQMGSARVNIAAVSSITYQMDPRTKAVLGTASGGRETSTQVFFKVVDAAQQGVGGVSVSYELTQASPAGAMVSPQSLTDDGGIAYTTLSAGNGIGIAAIHAVVTATIDAGTTMLIDTTHPGTPIVLGKPTDLGFTFSCPKRNLGALHSSSGVPPTRTVNESCNVSLADRNGNRVGLVTPVQFLVENGGGTIQPSVMTDTMGKATVTYDTTSSALPLDVPPIAGEPTLPNGKNPRDMTVTIVAVVAGSEEYWDGSGGQPANGKWDPGEWFVDLPEPFVDENDNGIWDPGEPAPLDGPRLNCATGVIEPPNGKWDGPNGCYDADIQLFRVFHVQWTGPLSGPLKFTPTMPPFTIPAGASVVYNFFWSDDYGSPMSVDGDNINVMQTGTNVGTVTLMAPGLSGDSMGFAVHYNIVEATESAAGSGMFTINGTCDQTKLPGPGPLTRCIHQTVMDSFGAGDQGTLTFMGRTPGVSADGGVRAPGIGTVSMTATHSFSSPIVQTFEADYP